MIISSLLRYLLGGYQGKLDLCHPISLSSGSSTSVLNMVGVNKEGPEEVDSLRLRSSLIYSSRLIGGAFSGRSPVTYLSCLRHFLVCVFTDVSSTYSHRSTLSPHSVIPLYPSILTRGSAIGGVLSEGIFLLLISLIEAFYSSYCEVISLGVCVIFL